MGIVDFKNQKYTLNKQCNISLVDAPLYMDARVSSISLKYYAFCLKNNQYMVRLHFAEIGLDTPKNPRIKRSRVFDVEIQVNSLFKYKRTESLQTRDFTNQY